MALKLLYQCWSVKSTQTYQKFGNYCHHNQCGDRSPFEGDFGMYISIKINLWVSKYWSVATVKVEIEGSHGVYAITFAHCPSTRSSCLINISLFVGQKRHHVCWQYLHFDDCSIYLRFARPIKAWIMWQVHSSKATGRVHGWQKELKVSRVHFTSK